MFLESVFMNPSDGRRGNIGWGGFLFLYQPVLHVLSGALALEIELNIVQGVADLLEGLILLYERLDLIIVQPDFLSIVIFISMIF